MDIEKELKAIRYLINDLILYVYGLHVRLDSIAPVSKVYEVVEPNVNGNDISFDLFTLPKKKYEELIKQYGVDIVTSSCARLDEYIKINNYIPYRFPLNALKQKFIKDELFERVKYKNENKDKEHLKGLEEE